MAFTNSQLAQKMSDLIGFWTAFATEYSNWLGGAIGGGPGSDGKYPLTDWAGVESLVSAPAQLQDDVSGMVSSASTHATNAAASAAAALISENNASTSAANALTSEGLADADRIAAAASATSSSGSAVTATAQANLATNRAGYAQEWANAAENTLVSAAAGGDQVDDYSAQHHAIKGAASAAAALVSELAAAASATLAATFDPGDFYTKILLDGGQLDTRYFTETEITAKLALYTLTSGLSITNWNTAYGWGNHAGLYSLLGHSHAASDTTTGVFAVARLGANGSFSITPKTSIVNYNRFAALQDMEQNLDWKVGIYGGFGSMTNGPTGMNYDPFLVMGNGSDVLSFLVVPRLAGKALAYRGSTNVAGNPVYTTWHYAAWTTTAADADLSLYSKTSALNIANWDTAFGWGNHASGGYAPTASPNFTGAVDFTGGLNIHAGTGSGFIELHGDTAAFIDFSLDGTGATDFDGRIRYYSDYFNFEGVTDIRVAGSIVSLVGHTHDVIRSKGNLAAETLRAVHDTGIYSFNAINQSLGGSTPIRYWSVLAWGKGTGGTGELATSWTSSGDELWFRSLRDTIDNWWAWKEIWHSGNLTNNSENWDTAYGWGDHSLVDNGVYKRWKDSTGAAINLLTLYTDDKFYVGHNLYPLVLRGSTIALLDTTTYTILNAGSNLSRDKLRVWNASNYAIGMTNNFTFGPFNTNYAMTFQMNSDAGRGWWWGHSSHTAAQGAMGLSTTGKMSLAHSLRLGYGESDLVIPGITDRLDVFGNGLFSGAALTTTILSIGDSATTNMGMLKLRGNIAGKESVLQCTNGNFHLDANVGNQLYLNFYNGTVVYFGNGASGTNANVTAAGKFTMTGLETSGAPTKSALGIPYYVTTGYAGGKMTVSATAPGTPAKGDIWFDTT